MQTTLLRIPSLLRKSPLVLLFLLTCCTIKLVDDYDAAISVEITETSKGVDHFYGELLAEPEVTRTYNKFDEGWLDLEVEIRSLVLRNRARPLNENSTAISESVLDLWLKYQGKHKTPKPGETYKDELVELHRERFTKLFSAMTVAEESKRLAVGGNVIDNLLKAEVGR